MTLEKSCFDVVSQFQQVGPVLPPFGCGPAALAAAAAAGLAGTLGAREQLGHELRDVWKLRVGVQHVHGLLHFLQTWKGFKKLQTNILRSSVATH